MTRRTAFVCLCMAISAFGLSGCASLWGGGKSTPQALLAEEEAAGVPANEAEYRARLETLVRRGVAETEGAAAERQNTVIYKRPYYFRQYENYPSGAASLDVAMRKTESKTAPYVADVSLDKVRFATRIHRRRDEAVADTNFLRDTGRETQTYEFRNGRWVRVGSLFLAEKSEENINGEWVPLEEEVQRTVAAEEQAADSWWRRAFGRITGR